jgi:lysophospholipase L1-like esterase
MHTTLLQRSLTRAALRIGLALAATACSSSGELGSAGAAGTFATSAGTGGDPGNGGNSSTQSGANSNGGAAASGGPNSASGGMGASGGSGGSSTAGSGSAGVAGTAGSGDRAGQAGGGAAGTAGAAGATNLPPVTVHIAGDSTVSQYVLDPKNPKSWAGWGQMLGANYSARATVVDEAVGGRTARRFIQEGHLAAILKAIRAGDYLLVQFGTNDSNQTATYTLNGVTYPYYAAAETDFKTYLQEYITGARDKGATPVLVTPPPRNSADCNGGRSLANYGQAMLELGQASSVAVVDLGLKTHAYLSAICPKPTTAAAETFFKINADGSIDGTHFQENGARIMAGFVADGISEAKLGLAAYRKP